MEQGRVIEEHKTRYVISADGREYSAVVRGAFHTNSAEGNSLFPKVGDYVQYTQTGEREVVIEEIMPRTSEIVRRSAGGVTPQVIVANVDLMFIVMGLDGDFNVSRLERYVLLAHQSGVDVVVLLTKRDTVANLGAYLEQVKDRVSDVPVHAISATTGDNMEVLYNYLHDTTTAVLLGSSGAGKSTITNWLLSEERQSVGAVRSDDSRGRHTTSARQLFALPHGGYLIDTPGMRELGLVREDNSVFVDIESLAAECRFRDCDHEKSAGCAIQEAITNGSVSHKQFENYQKLRREQEYFDSKTDPELHLQHKEKTKKMHKSWSKILKQKYAERDTWS